MSNENKIIEDIHLLDMEKRDVEESAKESKTGGEFIAYSFRSFFSTSIFWIFAIQYWSIYVAGPVLNSKVCVFGHLQLTDF